MDTTYVMQTLIGAVAGGALTGLSAYIGIAKSVSKLEQKIMSVEKDHNECKSRITQTVDALQKSVSEHHEKGPHITQDYKDLLQERFEFIKVELEHLHQAGKKSDVT